MMNSLINKTAKQLIRPRQFSSAATSASSGNDYISPFKDFFDMIDRGETSLKPVPQKPEDFLKCGIPESCLRFRTMSYGRRHLSPFVDINEHKVTLKVGLEHIPIESELEKSILQEIVGNRMNETQLQLSSNQFGSRLENKRHLVSMLDRIVLGMKKLAKEKEEDA